MDYATPQEGGGGICVYIKTLSKALLEKGHRVIVIAPGRNRSYEKSQEEGITVFRIPVGNFHWYVYRIPILTNWLTLPLRELEWGFAFWKGLRRFLRSEGMGSIDVLESAEEGNLFHALWKSVPLVIRMHGDTYTFRKYSGQKIRPCDRLARAMQRWCFRRADLLTAPSAFQAEEIMKECGNKVFVHPIPNPVDPFWMGVGNTNPGNPVVLYSGRIQLSKGTLVLLRSIPYVLKEVPMAKFWIAGAHHESIPEGVLKNVLDEIDVGDKAKILGPISWEALKKAYQQCALFVMPSYYEAFSISCIEAMACGRAVIATKAGALSEVVQDGYTGILVEPGNPKALGTAIVGLLKDTHQREVLGSNGRRRVAEKYQVQPVADQTLAVYQQAIGTTQKK